MKTTDDGGPAFPVPMIPCDREGGYTNVQNEGMTLRDYFAAKAMAAFIGGGPEAYLSWRSLDELSAMAYKHADSMLAARKKE